MNRPDYVFETSWEVCNKVGGIHTVLATKASSMLKVCPNVYFIGPDLGETSDVYFEEQQRFSYYRMGKWKIAGRPNAVLISWQHLVPQKNEIYAKMWKQFGVESHAAYGDYDDCSLFSYAAGQFVQDFCQKNNLFDKRIIAHSNEWQTAFFLFFLKCHCPSVATIFTTHATSIGRSIAGNNKPLYDCFHAYDGDQMAKELNMVSKHSAEKHAAHIADCFTTVSVITSRECGQLLNKPADIVTPNGFDCPTEIKNQEGIRQVLQTVAEDTLKRKFSKSPIFIATSGRCEWHNKGIDIFLAAMDQLDRLLPGNTPVVAFILIPYVSLPVLVKSQVSVIGIPYYLDGHSIPLTSPFKALRPYTYYEVLAGMDISIYPSYYEPWGYTPQESCSLAVPTITTSLSGFGRWVQDNCHNPNPLLTDGVGVIIRTDSNSEQVIGEIAKQIVDFIDLPQKERLAIKKKAVSIGKQTQWKQFFKFYEQAYHWALANRTKGC